MLEGEILRQVSLAFSLLFAHHHPRIPLKSLYWSKLNRLGSIHTNIYF